MVRFPYSSVLKLQIMFSSLAGNLSGVYFTLSEMGTAVKQRLIDHDFLFDKPVSPLLASASLARDWPDARVVQLGFSITNLHVSINLKLISIT